MTRVVTLFALSLATCTRPALEAPPAEPPTAPASAEAAPASSAHPASAHPAYVVRFDVDGVRYQIDLAPPGTVSRCDEADTTTCRPHQWRGLEGDQPHLTRMAERARTETCPSSEGALVHLDIDGQLSEFRLPPYPEDRDFMPPTDDTYEECAARTLVRSAMTIVTWE